MDYTFTNETDLTRLDDNACEECCRRMVTAGMSWLDKHPDAVPLLAGQLDAGKVTEEPNRDARELMVAIVDAGGDDPTGALHDAAIQMCLFARKQGWEAFLKRFRRTTT